MAEFCTYHGGEAEYPPMAFKNATYPVGEFPCCSSPAAKFLPLDMVSTLKFLPHDMVSRVELLPLNCSLLVVPFLIESNIQDQRNSMSKI